MPELPEVEAARRGIAEQLLGTPITRVELRLPKLIIDPRGLGVDVLVGRALTGVKRRGKYLALGSDDLTAVAHLKLSGQLVARGQNIPGFAAGHPVPHFGAELPHKSTHLMLHFDGGSTLYLTDIRHFGRVQLMLTDDLPAYWASVRLGPDAVSSDFSRDWFREAIARRKVARLKPLLLDQSFLAGLGNIYVDESLWAAELHPERLAASLAVAEVDRLYDAINAVMAVAVPIGGAQILNGKALPEPGEFPMVHGRAGVPCPRCGNTIIKTRVNGRGTYLCPNCQRL